jgi:hypothetical protein
MQTACWPIKRDGEKCEKIIVLVCGERMRGEMGKLCFIYATPPFVPFFLNTIIAQTEEYLCLITSNSCIGVKKKNVVLTYKWVKQVTRKFTAIFPAVLAYTVHLYFAFNKAITLSLM